MSRDASNCSADTDESDAKSSTVVSIHRMENPQGSAATTRSWSEGGLTINDRQAIFPETAFVSEANASPISDTARAALPALRLFALQREAGAGRLRDQPSLIVGDRALGDADGASTLEDAADRNEVRCANRPDEIDFQFQRRKTFALLEHRRVCRPHGDIGDVAEDAAVQRSHRVVMPRVGIELEARLARLDRGHAEADQRSNRRRWKLAGHGAAHHFQSCRHGDWYASTASQEHRCSTLPNFFTTPTAFANARAASPHAFRPSTSSGPTGPARSRSAISCAILRSPNASSGPKRHTTARPLTRHTDANWPTAATRYSRCSTDCTRSRSRSPAP